MIAKGFGTAYRFRFRRLPFFDSAAAGGGGVVELRTAPAPQLLVWRPELLTELFRADQRMPAVPSKTLGPLIGDTSVLSVSGARHTAYRQVIGPALRGRALASYQHSIRAAVATGVEELAIGSNVELTEWTRRLTQRIIHRVVFGDVDDELLETFPRWVDTALGSVRQTLLYRYCRLPTAFPSPWRSFLRQRDELDRIIVRRARASAACPASLAGLLLAGGEPLGTLSDDELRDQIVSLIFAGHETTASAMAWTLYWLDRDDQVRRDVQDELAATSDDGSTTENLPLLDAVCREALRISPPAMQAGTRTLAAEEELAGVAMPAGTTLIPAIYVAHHCPDSYPAPSRFDPRRFLGTRVAGNTYLPFGGGTRRCLGADLAMLELRMAVAAVLRHRSLRCLRPELVTPVQRGAAMGPGKLVMAVGPS